jgi:PKD repeat protein
VNWLWNFSSNPTDTSTSKNPPFRYDTAGIYNVQLITSNRFGCADTLSKDTRVYGLPKAKYENEPACVGDATLFSDLSIASDTALSFWAWNFGDMTSHKDTSNQQNPIYKYSATGNFDIRLIVKDYFGCLDTIDSTLTVNITPLAAFTLVDNYNGKQGQIKLTNLSTGADDYLWEFSNDKTSTEKDPITSFTDDGTYSIRLISTNQFDCADTTIYEYKLLFKGLYVPNAFAPTSTNLGVRLFQPAGHNLKTYHIQIFDVWGHQVWESIELDDKGAPKEGWDGTFEGQLLPQGNYMWKITATFRDDSPWNGSDVGVSASDKTMGTVTLIR